MISSKDCQNLNINPLRAIQSCPHYYSDPAFRYNNLTPNWSQQVYYNFPVLPSNFFFHNQQMVLVLHGFPFFYLTCDHKIWIWFLHCSRSRKVHQISRIYDHTWTWFVYSSNTTSLQLHTQIWVSNPQPPTPPFQSTQKPWSITTILTYPLLRELHRNHQHISI